VPTHQIPGYGEVVCHAAGIVEPITLSLFKMLSSETEAAEGWLHAAVERNSLAMLCRLDIALREIVKLGDTAKRDWANVYPLPVSRRTATVITTATAGTQRQILQ
jgi:hypothetical protein